MMAVLSRVEQIDAWVVVAALLTVAACRPSAPPVRVASASQPPPIAPLTPPAAARALDSDGDGTPDDADLCPDEAQNALGEASLDDGCPHYKVQRGGLLLRIDDWIPFAADSATVDPDSQVLIDYLARWIAGTKPTITLVEIVGHATAKEKHDHELAVARAEAVRTALVARGVLPARLTVRGHAASDGWTPIRRSSADGRAFESSVEFRLLKNALGVLGADGFHMTPACMTEQPLPQQIDFVPGPQNQLSPEAAAALDTVAAYLIGHPEAGTAKVTIAYDGGLVASRRVLDPASYPRVTLVRDQLLARGVPRARLVRQLPSLKPPDARRNVRIFAMLPNPFHDPVAPGCIDARLIDAEWLR
jgi:outer membrane protein OmpA-like peptidoglycan-associated protein